MMYLRQLKKKKNNNTSYNMDLSTIPYTYLYSLFKIDDFIHNY